MEAFGFESMFLEPFDEEVDHPLRVGEDHGLATIGGGEEPAEHPELVAPTDSNDVLVDVWDVQGGG